MFVAVLIWAEQEANPKILTIFLVFIETKLLLKSIGATQGMLGKAYSPLIDFWLLFHHVFIFNEFYFTLL